MSTNREKPRFITPGDKGGKHPAPRGPGNDGFTECDDRHPKFTGLPRGEAEVGRDVTLGKGGGKGNGKSGKSRGRMQDYA